MIERSELFKNIFIPKAQKFDIESGIIVYICAYRRWGTWSDLHQFLQQQKKKKKKGLPLNKRKKKTSYALRIEAANRCDF